MPYAICIGVTSTHRKSKKEEARTSRALSRGTAKRLSKKHAKPRPFGRARSVLRRAGKFAVFGIARSRSYAKLFWLNNNRQLVFLSAAGACRDGARRSARFGFGTRRVCAGNSSASIRENQRSGNFRFLP